MRQKKVQAVTRLGITGTQAIVLRKNVPGIGFRRVMADLHKFIYFHQIGRLEVGIVKQPGTAGINAQAGKQVFPFLCDSSERDQQKKAKRRNVFQHSVINDEQ